MKVYLVGNLLVESDNLPLLLRPYLQKQFPQVEFEEIDPNEDFIPEEGSVIIDTVDGIDKVTWFDSIDRFCLFKSVTAHDYDLGLHLKLLKKLGKLGKLRILGIPKNEKIDSELINDIKNLLMSKNPEVQIQVNFRG